MATEDELRLALSEAVRHAEPGLATAEALCRTCVALMDVDGAAVTLFHEGRSRGTFGSSGDLSRRLEDLQFTFGEGPCSAAVRDDRPVLVDDLDDPGEQRWPAYTAAVLASGVRAVFALPVRVSATPLGALDLYRERPGPLSVEDLTGCLLAADLAALPLLDLMSADVDWSAVAESADGWSQLASLARVEVYQATGMIMVQLDVGPTEALVRLRARAFSEGTTASRIAWQVIEARLSLDADGSWRIPPRDPD